MKTQRGFTIVELLIVIVIVGILLALVITTYNSVKNRQFDGNIAPQATTQEQQPFTKTRCDITGFQSSSIIEDEAKKGYQFTGRINTPLCGENGMSFQLRNDQ